MKKLYIILLAGMISVTSYRANAQQVSVSFQVFYDQLSPYGSWVNYESYGYVWVPTEVPNGFRPYATDGHWIYTDDGWTWVSDYPWGWAAFHYGNWFYDQSYGWMWLPDYEWAPAWVTWGQYRDNYCWAPIGPHVNIGVSFGSYRPPGYYWTFVPHTYITSVNINRYYVNRVSNTTVINNITVINNVNKNNGGRQAFMRGPQPQSVERYTHTAVRPVQIRETATPGRAQVQNGQLAIYRPSINRNNTVARPAPARVEDVHHLQPNNLPAVNRHVQPNNVNAKNNNSGNGIPGRSDRGNANPSVNRNPINNPSRDNNKNAVPPVRPIPHTKADLPHPSNAPIRESNPETNKNKPAMKPSSYDKRVPPPANRPVNPAPIHNNRPVTNPDNVKQNYPNPHTIQQPRSHPAPPNRPTAPPAHNPPQPQPKHDQHER